MDEEGQRLARPTIKVVGPCKSGKSTLVNALRELGYQARGCAQEHSSVFTMWQRIAPADVLIYLDVSLEAIRKRSSRDDWTEQLLAQQRQRLSHAREHCDLLVVTDDLGSDQVLEMVVAYLVERGSEPGCFSQEAD